MRKHALIFLILLDFVFLYNFYCLLLRNELIYFAMALAVRRFVDAAKLDFYYFRHLFEQVVHRWPRSNDSQDEAILGIS